MTNYQQAIAQLLAAHPIKYDARRQDSESWYCGGTDCTRSFRTHDQGVEHQAEILTSTFYAFPRNEHRRTAIDSREGVNATLTEVLTRAVDAGTQAHSQHDRDALVDTLTQLWHEMRIVDDAADVPIRAVALNHADGSIVARFDHTHGVVFGDDRPFPWLSKYLGGPLTILWHPADGWTAL